jgi:hypothetical protein
VATAEQLSSSAGLLRARAEVLETDTDGQAEQIRSRLQRSVDALDPDLAPESRRQREEALRQDAQTRINELRQNYEARKHELRLQAHWAAFGSIGQGADAIVFRDAADRAGALSDERSAVALMGRAIRSDDAVLARAVASEANARNWREPLELWARQGNGSLELARLARELDSAPGSRERANRIFRWRI